MQNVNAKPRAEFKSRLYMWVLRLIKFIDALPKDSVSSVMSKQLVRSGTSVLANFVEAGSASSKKDYTNFFTYALKSANESKVWLSLLKDSGKGEPREIAGLSNELTEIANILGSSIITLKGKR